MIYKIMIKSHTKILKGIVDADTHIKAIEYMVFNRGLKDKEIDEIVCETETTNW